MLRMLMLKNISRTWLLLLAQYLQLDKKKVRQCWSYLGDQNDFAYASTEG